MAERPWVTPDEVRDYSEIKEVSSRADNRLSVDISRAEQMVISYTNNDFSDYEIIPENVRIAVILLAEAYGYNSVNAAKKITSETYDDYSYTAQNGAIDLSDLGIKPLLDEFVRVKPKNGVTLRIGRI